VATYDVEVLVHLNRTVRVESVGAPEEALLEGARRMREAFPDAALVEGIALAGDADPEEAG
jgi:hypothetical protein